MAEIEIKSQTPLSYAEVAKKLEIVKKHKIKDEELGFRAKKAEEFLETVGKDSLKKIEELQKKLAGLEMSRIKEKQIINLANLMPEDEDSVKIILANDNITLKQEDVKKIVDCIKK
ncbi:hypothetical protein HOM13_03490 [Candidatus Woesearchaeota archaeon]|jgi:DNA-directed RNA polymerase subunit F|nr:hypothetical protein [Candidatus Woesearchaeota archaeon]MBT5215772.1 hypothetical protein [Candidatus Woesearchaeota archaeon]MBT6402452.1 hypothetical protein [Candidatus Woesearchaeota archaeon]